PEATSPFGLDDTVPFGVQLDVVADAAAKRAGGVLDNRKAHVNSRWMAFCHRPDRAARQTFSPIPDRDSFPECAGACTCRFQSFPMPAGARWQPLPAWPAAKPL